MKDSTIVDGLLSAWVGHKEFAIWLVNHIKPKTIVDLGVDYGFSCFSFAIPEIGTVYGVDAFEGDIHTGTRDTQQEVLAFKEQHNLDNVNIIKAKFNDLASTWDKTIDILHIDGLHTYEAVQEDFNTWEKFVHTKSIILFHDTVAFESTVGEFFKGINGYHKFQFTHSAGLGVMCQNRYTFNEIFNHFENYPGVERLTEK